MKWDAVLMLGLLGLATFGWAQNARAITVDGTRDAEYGEPVSVQAVDTQFGDANPPLVLGGSELDAAYAAVDGGRLYLLFTGNHEPNFNKLEIFIDSVPGGENTLSGTPQYDFNLGDHWNSQDMGGMVVDTGLEIDYHLFSRWGGNDTPGPYEADFVDRQGGTSPMVPGSAGSTPAPVDLVAAGVIEAGALGPNASGPALTQNLEFAINNNNADGVFAGIGAADQQAAAAVTTGMEFSIALADLGNPAPGSMIKIMAVINNSDHHYLSNQFLGPLTPPQGNLGGDGMGGDPKNLSAINLNNFAGNQFFTVTLPGPSPVPGDYNGNGTVDAADYVLWRSGGPLQNEVVTIGSATPEDYTEWRARFGNTMGSGGALGTGAVPEPASAGLALVAAIGVWALGRRN